MMLVNDMDHSENKEDKKPEIFRLERREYHHNIGSIPE